MKPSFATKTPQKLRSFWGVLGLELVLKNVQCHVWSIVFSLGVFKLFSQHTGFIPCLIATMGFDSHVLANFHLPPTDSLLVRIPQNFIDISQEPPTYSTKPSVNSSPFFPSNAANTSFTWGVYFPGKRPWKSSPNKTQRTSDSGLSASLSDCSCGSPRLSLEVCLDEHFWSGKQVHVTTWAIHRKCMI